LRVSVLLLTLNEERNLPSCLAAIRWCDDVVVVDSFSRDSTAEIAAAAGARVVQRAFTNFADQRNFALEKVEFRHDWVFHLDADEIVTPALAAEIEALPEAAPFDAYRIAGRLMFADRWMRHAGMYPVYQVRLTRRGGFRFIQVGHGQREPEGWRIGSLREGYDHYAFSKGLDDWIERHHRYAADEAVLATQTTQTRLAGLFSGDRVERRRTAKLLSYRLPFRPLLRFLYIYVLRLGFLDGRPGYRYAKLLAFYESLIDRKVRQLRDRRSQASALR
jgi:glycosyltransferase involved in cell wall biosynthesis